MNSLLKRQTCSVLKWAFANLAQNNLTPSKTTIKGTSFSYITQNPRFYGRKAHIQSHDLIKDNSVYEAQDALIEYLHSTRNLQYVDAENISRNSPNFLEKLLKSVENEKGC
ncbi:hypothetical protein HanOQP8_Chr01g0012341 [Helianthus annuus]|nr:hypothetical protein HanOQP8_Chr01g0012341 [Helianthus annuus]